MSCWSVKRTLVINALRGHCAEFGLIVAQLGRCRYGREDALRQGYRNGHRERQLTGKKVAVDLPYQGMDNVHILEGAMRVFWKNASPRLSDLLDHTRRTTPRNRGAMLPACATQSTARSSALPSNITSPRELAGQLFLAINDIDHTKTKVKSPPQNHLAGVLPGDRGLMIERANHVWRADITYIPVRRGFLYLVAIMDWASRHVLAWRLSNTLDAGFCTDALDQALARHGTPEIFNTDQGSQFTSFAFTGRLREAGIRISMDGRGRCLDNIFIERLWRSLKYEAVYLGELADGFEARRVIGEWIDFYNTERPHSALGGKTPAEAYRGAPPVDMMDKPLRALPTSPQAQQQRQGDRFKGILAA